MKSCSTSISRAASWATRRSSEACVRAPLKNEICLVTCGSAFKNKGVQAVLDAIVEYMPSPTEVPPVKGQSDRGEPMTRKPDDDAPFSALAFKILNDPFVGNLTFFRVYSGTLNSGDQVFVPNEKSYRAYRASPANARQRPLRDQGSPCRRYRGGRRPQGRDHRRHPVGSRQGHHSREDGVPRTRDFRGGGTQDQGGPRKDGFRSAASGQGRPFVPCAHRPGIGPDHHLGYGRAAPRNHRRPHEARIQGRCERRQAAGGVPRNHSCHASNPRENSFASQAAAANTATCG